jgi:hypothetical protein
MVKGKPGKGEKKKEEEANAVMNERKGNKIGSRSDLNRGQRGIFTDHQNP